MGTIPAQTQTESFSSKPAAAEEEKTKVHVWTWDVQTSAVFKLQMQGSSLEAVIYMEMKE